MSLTTKKLNKIKKSLGNDQYYYSRETLKDSYDTINNYTVFNKGIIVEFDGGKIGLAYKHTQNRYNSCKYINRKIKIFERCFKQKRKNFAILY